MTYIECLSNYCMDVYPNTSASFRNHMANSIDVAKFSEIALAEISYVQNFPIEDKLAKWSLFDFEFSDDSGQTFGKFYHFTLNQQYISTPLDLVSTLNEEIMKKCPRLKETRRFIFSLSENGKIWMNFEPNDYISVILRGTTLVMIGATDKIKTPKDTIFVGKSKQKKTYTKDGVVRTFNKSCEKEAYQSSCEKTDFFALKPTLGLIDHFLVMCNLVADSNVASSLTSLLKYVTVSPLATPRRVTISYGSDRLYRKLAYKTSIDEIFFELRSSDGELLPLDGSVRICIHLR